MKLLLTGGTGYIGLKIVQALCDKHDFTLLVRKSSPNFYRLQSVQDKIRIVEYEHYHDFNSLFASHSFDCLIHLAATCKGNEEQILENNINFPSHLLFAYAHENPKACIINTSTFFIYSQDGSYHPKSYYGASKKAFEDLLAYYALKGAKVSTLRLYDVYGIDDWRGKIYQIIIQAIQNAQTLRLTDGLEWMNHVSIDDVVRAFACALEDITSPNTQALGSQQFFQVRSPQTLQLKHVVEILEQVLGKKTQVEWGAFPRPCERLAGKPYLEGPLVPNWQALDDLKQYYQRELAT